jgi:GH25 family lysozyme M1 (1,4-beta-N-acetylmuramidase)
MGPRSMTARGRAARRSAVASVAFAAVVYAGMLAGGPFRLVPDAIAKQVTAPAPTTNAVTWHNNVGAAHSPVVERMLAGRAGAAEAATRTAVPAGEALGVDVSSLNHQGGAPIDWAEVAAAGYKFAFIKATEGSYYQNPYYASDAAAARAAGLFTAAYHFAIPNNSSGTLQADLALDAAGDPASDGTTLPMILDAEYDPYVQYDGTNECYGLSKTAMAAWIGAFATEVIRRTGEAPVIYTTSDWWKKCTGNSSAFGADPLWIASWGKPATVPPSWTAFTYWQFSSTARVPGISVKTDVSYFSPATLAAAEPAEESNMVGAAVSLPVRSLAATAGNTISYSAAGLPTGLTIDPQTGVITGPLPGTAESFPVAVKLTGPAAQTQTLNFTWQIHGPVSLTGPGQQAGRAGSPVSLQLAATDGLAGCSLNFTAVGLPPGLTIGPCGRITGQPYRPGSYQPIVTVSDSASPAPAQAKFRWTISSPSVVTAGKIHLAVGGTAMCLADRPGASGTAVKVWACEKSAGQRWNLFKNGSIEQSGKCLDAITLADGSPYVAFRSCTGSIGQIWQQVAQGGLASAQTGQCLTEPKVKPTDGAAIGLADCAGISRQAWTLPPGPLAPGIPGQCLTKVSASSGHAAHVILTTCRGTRAQNWLVTPTGAIRFANLCLDAGTAPAAGTPVTLTTCRARPSQQWQPLPALATTASTVATTTGSTGTFLVSPAAGLCFNASAIGRAASPLTLTYCSIGYPRETWRTS